MQLDYKAMYLSQNVISSWNKGFIIFENDPTCSATIFDFLKYVIPYSSILCYNKVNFHCCAPAIRPIMQLNLNFDFICLIGRVCNIVELAIIALYDMLYPSYTFIIRNKFVCMRNSHGDVFDSLENPCKRIDNI